MDSEYYREGEYLNETASDNTPTREQLVTLYIEVPEGEDIEQLQGLRIIVPGWSQDFRYEVMAIGTLR